LESICRQLWISRSRSIGPKERPTTHFRHTHKLSLHSLSRLRKSLNQEKQRSSSSNSCHSPDRYTIEKKPDPERERERERTAFLTSNRTSNQREKKPKPKKESFSPTSPLLLWRNIRNHKARWEETHNNNAHSIEKKTQARTHAKTTTTTTTTQTTHLPCPNKRQNKKPKLLNYRENREKKLQKRDGMTRAWELEARRYLDIRKTWDRQTGQQVLLLLLLLAPTLAPLAAAQ
jgi:hypothetical protein